MKNSVAAAFAIAALGAGAYDLPPCTVPMNIGVQMKADTFNEATLREVRGLGFRVVRRGLYWSSVEKEKGVYDFSEASSRAAACRRRRRAGDSPRSPSPRRSASTDRT